MARLGRSFPFRRHSASLTFLGGPVALTGATTVTFTADAVLAVGTAFTGSAGIMVSATGVIAVRGPAPPGGFVTTTVTFNPAGGASTFAPAAKAAAATRTNSGHAAVTVHTVSTGNATGGST